MPKNTLEALKGILVGRGFKPAHYPLLKTTELFHFPVGAVKWTLKALEGILVGRGFEPAHYP